VPLTKPVKQKSQTLSGLAQPAIGLSFGYSVLIWAMKRAVMRFFQ
jgi:hypothetical protein